MTPEWNGITNPDESFAAKERGEMLREALRLLDGRELGIVALRMRGKTTREVGALVGASHVTVMNIETRALEKMRLFFHERNVKTLADLL